MKCLVTGSEGFIGKNLVAELRARGHEAVEVDIKPPSRVDANIVNIALSDPFDVIFHLACVNQMQAVDLPELNLRTNALSTKRLAKQAAEQGSKFIYTSTASVYGQQEVLPTPEFAELDPLTDYAVAKLAGEFFVKNSGADYTILRLSNVYGPHQTLENPYCGVIGRFFEQIKRGEPLTVIRDGAQTRDFTYVGDVVGNLIKVGTTERIYYRNQLFNLSHGDETSVMKLAQKCLEAADSDLPVQFVDRRVIDGVNRRCLSNRLGRAYGLVCNTRLDYGLEQTWEWMKA